MTVINEFDNDVEVQISIGELFDKLEKLKNIEFSNSSDDEYLLNVDEQQAQKIDCLAHAKIATFDMNQTPPHNAAPLYEAMAEVLGVHDLYAQFKADSSEKAKAFLPLCEQKIKVSSHKLFEATKTAVAGNVIDLAAVMLYDLAEELEKIYHTPFAIDDFVLLEQQLAHTQDRKSVV